MNLNRNPNRILRRKDLPGYVGLQRTAIDDAIRAGRFPAPIKVGVRAVGWIESEIVEWQQNRIAERDRGRDHG